MHAILQQIFLYRLTVPDCVLRKRFGFFAVRLRRDMGTETMRSWPAAPSSASWRRKSASAANTMH